jgi:hypothetical protein
VCWLICSKGGVGKTQMKNIMAKLCRICMPKPQSGKLEVSDEIHQQWKSGKAGQDKLATEFAHSGFNKDFAFYRET